MMEEIPAEEIKVSELSAANDIGFVFYWKNRIFRAINAEAVDKVKDIFKSGMIEELTENNLIPKSWITDYKLEGYGLVTEHAKIDVVSYPYEWTFSMLKDAALTVLKVNEIARKYNYQTHDCHAFNIVLDGMHPKYVDLGSFIKIEEGYRGWVAYEEFIRSYYYPLKIWSADNSFFARRALAFVGDMITHESYVLYKYPFTKILGSFRIKKMAEYYFNYRILSTIPLIRIKNRFPGIIGSLIIFIKENNLLFLQSVNYEKLIRKSKRISHKPSNTKWGQYQNGVYTDSGKLALSPRFERIIEIIKDNDIKSVVELGGNQGILSRILLDRTHVECATCIDYDEDAVELMYTLSKREHISLNPILQNCMFPVVGSCGKPPWERFKSEVVIALALTHHIILSQGLRIEFILERISRYTKKYIIIEFMPMGLWDGRYAPPIPEWYTIDWFRRSFEQYFKIILEEQIEENRILFFGELLNSIAK